MKITGSGSTRSLKVDGKSYLMPKTLSVGGKKFPAVVVQARFGSCTVNGKKLSEKSTTVTYVKNEVTMENLVVMRALSQTLMSVSGPARNKIHIIAAALVMKRFDREHPDSGILDTDVVTVSSKRHVYVKESTFLASELRQLDIHVELGLLAASLLRDKAVMSTTLDPAPESSMRKTESAATERALLDAGVVDKKRKRVRSKGPRSITCDDGTSWLLPQGVYSREKPLIKRLHLLVTVRSCQVNGRVIGRSVGIAHGRPATNKRTILALRATHRKLFPVDEPARYQVHRVVAAVILRAFDQDNPGSDVLDETVVTVRIEWHGYVKESSYVAGDLRVMNQNEVAILTELFLNDPEAMSGELEPAPASASTGSTTRDFDSSTASCKRAEGYKEEAAKRADEARMTNPTTEPTCSSDATVVGEKRRRSDGQVWRVVSRDKVDSLPLPSGIYLDDEDAGGSKTLRLKVKLGAVWVNGEECMFRKKMKIVGGVALHACNIAALTSLRDDIALGLGASPRVKMIIAAKAFRSWLRRRRDSLIPDSAIVTITDGTGTPTSAGALRPRIVSTAGNLRGVDVEKPRVVRELLSALGGTHADREDGSESQPAVVVTEAEDGNRVEAREGSAPGVEEPWVGSGTLDVSAQRPKKRKVLKSEETYRGCDEAARGHVKEGKKKRKAKGERQVRKRNSSSGGHEGAEDDSAVRKAEKTVIDLASDSSVETTMRKKRQREGEGSSVCGVKCSVAVEEDTRKKSKSANTKCSARQEGVTGPASTPYEEHTKKRESRREQQSTYSSEPTRLGAPIKGLKKTNTGEVGKRSRCSVAQAGSAQESATGKAKMDRNNLAPALSAKHPSKKRRREKKSKSGGWLLSDESTHSDGPLKGEDAKKGRAGKESQGRSSSRIPAPEGGAQECTARIGERAIIDLTTDPPERQIKKKKKKKKKSRKRTKRQSREAENPRVETGHPLVKSRKKKLMDWIANG